MPVVHNPESEYAKELAKWDTPRSLGGMKPDGYEPYPRMLYRAITRADGRVVLDDPADEGVARSCQRIVRSAGDEAAARGQGWCLGPQAALEAAEQQAQAVARAAAEVAAAAQRMTPHARAELADADAATIGHVVDVPTKKAGPARKAVVQTDG